MRAQLERIRALHDKARRLKWEARDFMRDLERAFPPGKYLLPRDILLRVNKEGQATLIRMDAADAVERLVGSFFPYLPTGFQELFGSSWPREARGFIREWQAKRS